MSIFAMQMKKTENPLQQGVLGVFYLKRVLLNHKILTIVNHSVRYNRYS